jgi:hypothetical protein
MIQSWDCNSMYGWALAQSMPIGDGKHFVVTSLEESHVLMNRIKSEDFIGFIKADVTRDACERF